MKGKKILLLLSSLCDGGMERVTLNLAEDWSRHGAEIVVVTLQSVDGDIYDIPAGVRRIALDLPSKSVSLLSVLGNNMVRFWVMRRVLREEKPNVVIGMQVAVSVTLALARSRSMVAIGMEHGHPPMFSLGRVREWLRRYFYGRLDAVVALTVESADWLREHTRARKVAVIPNAVVLPVVCGEPRLEVRDVVPSGRKILLAAGRLVEEKGFDRLLTAFAQVAGRFADWRLVILGEGEERGVLEAQLRALGLEGRVCLPGRAGNMAEWYRAVDGFVLSSPSEGFGMVLAEAMAHGCASVSVDCGGPGHIIRDGVDGLLVAQDDGGALADGLERLMGDEGLRARLGARAVEVRERFAPAQIRDMWAGLFAELEGRGAI